MKTKESIHELFAAAVELTKAQAREYNLDYSGIDKDYAEGPKVMSEETEEICEGFFLTRREMFLAPGEWFYEVVLNDGEPRRFALYVEMLEYLRDVSDIIARRIDPFWEANQDA